MSRKPEIEALLNRASKTLLKINEEYEKSINMQTILAELRIDIKDYFGNLRSALDFLAHDIVEKYCLNANPKNNLYFPICADQTSFDNVMKKLYPITPCLWFDNEGEEAVNFYSSLFDNSSIKKITRYGKEGFEYHQKPEGSVMTVEFELNGQPFLALNGGPVFQFNESLSFFVYCESEERINFLYEKLSEDGSLNMPLSKYDWSPKYAWVKDKFGV